MTLEEFDLLIKELFTEKPYNLFLLHGFDIPELQNKSFSPHYFWKGLNIYTSKLIIIPKTIKIAISFSLRYRTLQLILDNNGRDPKCIYPFCEKINQRDTSTLQKMFMEIIHEYSEYTRI